jgi:hypothetical protein
VSGTPTGTRLTIDCGRPYRFVDRIAELFYPQ